MTINPKTPQQMLLPVRQREQMAYDYAVFAWRNFQSTVSRIQSYGKEVTRMTFPNGLPKFPVASDFGSSVIAEQK